MRTHKKTVTRSAVNRVRRSKSSLVLTVGHSTRPIADFISLLKSHKVTRVVDVRTIPRSRHNPQFNSKSLAASLRNAHIGYVHMPQLGGLRRPSRSSPNTGWHNASFRGFADYMQSTQFEQELNRLIRMAKHGRQCLMCAEAVPWRCHRSLIADALLARHIRVEHVLSFNSPRAHALTSFAKVRRGRITYPPESDH